MKKGSSIALIVVSSLFGFSSCNTANTSYLGGNVPSEIVGEWVAGSGGTSWTYNTNTGQFGTPNGSGLYVKFSSDGTYAYGVQAHQSLYGCSTYVQGFQSGYVITTDSALEFHPTQAKKKFTDTCVAKNNTEGPDNTSVWSWTWQITNEGLYVEGNGSGTLTRL
jgi:hypothetical protein